jgi:hypothetical protein
MFGDFDFFMFGGFELNPKQKAFCLFSVKCPKVVIFGPSAVCVG